MAKKMEFNDQYSEQVQLITGTQIRLRLVQPDDKQHLVKAFEHISSSSRYMRFLGTKNLLSEGDLRYFTEIDQYNHFALGALELDDSDQEVSGAGIARFIRLPTDTECAEVGITVIDRAKRKGIGQLLLERLITAAIERGIKRLRFECLSENRNMRQLIKKLNDQVRFEREHGLLIAEIVLPKPVADNHQYPIGLIEDLSLLLRDFTTDALMLQADFNMRMIKRSLDAATAYKERYH